jgi:tagaturonate reductase
MEQLSRYLPLVRIEKNLPERILMFGEGAFLRAFACCAINEMNQRGLWNGGITVIQPIPEGKIELLRKQDGLFTVLERGIESGEKRTNSKLITCVNDYINPYDEFERYIKKARNPELRFVFSNTTEEGIIYRDGELLSDKPQVSFPGKVTAFLYERFSFFNGDFNKGLLFFPCELIDNNGLELKKIIFKYATLWNLGNDFFEWVEKSCVFANTLVDRIVAGYPTAEANAICEELGYRDELLDACELFFFWAIEGPPVLRQELPLDKAGFNVIFSDNIKPHRLKKVRLLNGAHTCLAYAALICGFSTVGEAVSDIRFKKYIEKLLYKEIIPVLDINRNVLEGFAKSVIERFCNPFIKHELHGITLNSVSKFKTRVLPTILEYQKMFNSIPPILTFSFATMIAFYKNGGRFKINDDEKNIAFLRDNTVDVILKNTSAWGTDFTDNFELCTAVEKEFRLLKAHGINPLIERLIND